MDALSRATLKRWEALEYHLGRTGVEKVSFKVKIAANSALGEATATGTYGFNGKAGTLKWDKPEYRRMFLERGWSAATFDRLFVADFHRRALAKTKLTARKTATGVSIEVQGKHPVQFRSFHYNADGIAVRAELGLPAPTAKKGATILLQHRKFGRFQLRTGFTSKLPTETGDTLTARVDYTYKAVGKYQVYAKVTETLHLGKEKVGAHVLTFTDYKINGKLIEPKAKPQPVTADLPKPPAKKRQD